MRTIKFRVWFKAINAMYDPQLLTSATVNETRQDMPGLYLPFDKDTVLMQYTGLKDKNGKEIYEGDIVKYDDSDISTKPIKGIAEVIYNTDLTLTPSPCFALWFIRNLDFNSPMAGFYHNMLASMEVIGNIYENKELLNETN